MPSKKPYSKMTWKEKNEARDKKKVTSNKRKTKATKLMNELDSYVKKKKGKIPKSKSVSAARG